MNIKNKFKSDKGAIGSTEMLLLLAVTMFIVLMVFKYVVKPLETTSVGIGKTITEMDPTQRP